MSSSSTKRVAILAESLFVLLALAGYIAMKIEIDASRFVSAALIGLSVVFIFNMFVPSGFEPEKQEKYGIKELMAWSVIPNVLWISSAVSALGISFHLMESGDGSLLLIGAATIAVCFFVLLILSLIGVKYLSVIKNVLYRAIPTLIVALLILF